MKYKLFLPVVLVTIIILGLGWPVSTIPNGAAELLIHDTGHKVVINVGDNFIVYLWLWHTLIQAVLIFR